MSRWLAFDALKGGGLDQSPGFAETFRERQVDRMAIVGCARENFPLIAASTRSILAASEEHMVNEYYLFETRPSLAELGIYGQLSKLGIDPIAQTMMRDDFPYTFCWLAQIGEVYVPFLLANAVAHEVREETFSIEVQGMPYTRGCFKYQVKCLADLRQRYSDLNDTVRKIIDPLLDQYGRREFLT